MPLWLSTILSSLFVAVCTAVVTVRLSVHRFYTEWWWERKADAYSRIVEALHYAMEDRSEQSHESMTQQHIPEEREKRLSEDYARASRELNKATGIGAFIISDEVADALAKLQNRRRLDPKDCPWFEICNDEFGAYKKTLAEVKKLARKELKGKDK